MLHLQEAIPLQGVIHGVQVPVGFNIQNQISQYNSTCACNQTPRQNYNVMWRCSGLMVSVLDSRLSSPSFSPGLEHCVVFLGKTLYSPSASFHPGLQMGNGKFNAGDSPSHPGGSRNTPSCFMLQKL